jgi:hypothetical protein
MIKVLSNSGKFYVNSAYRFLDKLATASSDRGVDVKFLLLNPVCSQAILRAIAEDSPTSIKECIGHWNWGRHAKTDLYKDTRDSILELHKKIREGKRFEVRLHHTGPACSLFLTPHTGFIDQYTYGRSKRRSNQHVFAEDYPTFNFGRPIGESSDTPELEVLESHFDSVWDSYSIDSTTFLEMEISVDRLKVEFDKSMKEVLRWSDDVDALTGPN